MSKGPWKTVTHRRVLPDGSVERLCRKCNEWKPLDKMAKQHDCVDGRSPTCKRCRTAITELAKARRDEADEARLREVLSVWADVG